VTPLILAAALSAAAPAAPARVGDWTVRCAGDGPARVCEAVQTMVEQPSGREAVRVGIALQKGTGRFGVQARTPLGLRLDTGAMLRFGDRPGDAIEGLTFNRCLPEGCYAEKPLSAAELERLGRAQALELVVLDLKGTRTAVKMSSKGLGEAIARLRE
jgi:invasion protein IalB